MIVLRELKRLTPVLEAQVMDNNSRYLVTVPDNATPAAIDNIGRMLDAAGLPDSIIVHESVKFYVLEKFEEPEPKKPWHRNIFGR